MNIEDTPSAQATLARNERPIWPTALIALAVLFALSEASYMLLGVLAQRCLDKVSACGQAVGAMSDALFLYATTESGAPSFMVKFSFGLPGFNNLFYTILSGVAIDELGKFMATVAISLLAGFLVIWGFLAAAAGRGIAMKLLLAIAFALGWFALYNKAEASVYGTEFIASISARYLEIPIAAISLLIVSLFARRRGAR